MVFFVVILFIWLLNGKALTRMGAMERGFVASHTSQNFPSLSCVYAKIFVHLRHIGIYILSFPHLSFPAMYKTASCHNIYLNLFMEVCIVSRLTFFWYFCQTYKMILQSAAVYMVYL